MGKSKPKENNNRFLDHGAMQDNIPGVKGIGEKKGQNVGRQFGSIENVYDNIDQVKGAMKEKLLENKEMAFISKN